VDRFLDALRATLKILEPFTRSTAPGSLAWDGAAYVKAPMTQLDPHALAWSSTLATIAALIERQSSPLSVDQLRYLRSELFGGMGSFLDFQLDEERFGTEALTANKRLIEARQHLFDAFKEIERDGSST
jgi:hypothetical protein